MEDPSALQKKDKQKRGRRNVKETTKAPSWSEFSFIFIFIFLKFKIFFYLKLIFLVFLNHFNILVLKINFKK